MHTVGIDLKKEREANNISLEEVARLTKISQVYLERIERNEFDKIPQGPYIKGYISSYASAIGCDAEKLISLYESENRKQIEAEADRLAAASIDCGQQSADTSRKKEPKQNGSLWLSKLRSWFNTIVSFVVVKGASFKAARKPIESIDSSKQDMGVHSRHNDLRVKQTGFIGTLYRRLADRRIWLFSCAAIVGAGILILAGVGFYHLFLYGPDSFTVTEAKRSHDQLKTPLPSSGSQPSTVLSPSADKSATVDTPERHVNKNVLSEPAKPDAGVSDTDKKAENASGTSRPGIQAGAPSSDASSTTNRDASNRDTTDTEGALPALTRDPSPESTIVDAPVRVLKATVCRAVENLTPVGVGRVFPLSTGKIYVWTEIEATQVPSKIHHIYYFSGEKISDVSLEVRSPRWRTWSFKTIDKRRYRGEWRVDIATADGNILRQLFFEVN